MPDPTTSNILLDVPTRGSDPGTWDVPVNFNSLAVDGFLGGVQAISASNAPITLTAPAGIVTPSGGPTQSQNAVINFTGTLSSGVTVTLTLPGYMIIGNFTTGAFVLTFRAVGVGEVIAIEQGSIQHVYNDGTNVKFVNLPPVGSYWDICDATTPAWVTGCTKPPFLVCDGSTFNATTYPYLNLKLGGNTLPDLRGVARYTLNQGTGRLTSAGSGLDGNTRYAIKTTQSITLGLGNLPPIPSANSSQSILVTPDGGVNVAPISTAGWSLVSVNPAVGGVKMIQFGGALGQTSSFRGDNVINVTSTGTSSTPFGVVGPGTVSGITLIRAA